ncbi:FtsX-like permease family protein [Neobacillus niacini]|uniref:ABC transporter permease n=1 Tax=Neobacillus niacini TaxID=86668 RepID=UPI00285E3CA9|nr:FtsX-like permease family protein [Neobacillus niacini]MDR6998391.1 putative ABC transport system permease protein [Neobacillus niacini]
MLVFIISGLAHGLSMNNASSMINMPADSFYLQKAADGRIDRSHFQVDLGKLADKNKVQPLGIQMGSISKLNSENKLDVTYMAINEGAFFEPKVVEGEESGIKNTVLLDQSLKSEKIKVGSIVEDSRTGTKLTVSGFMKDQTFSHTPAAIVSFATWDNLSGATQKGEYNAIVLKTDNKSLKKQIGILVKDGEWVQKDQVIKGIPGYNAEQNSLMMMLTFLIVIAVFVLAAFFYIMTIQKTAQFGILKAIGAKSSFLVKSTVFQVIILTLINIAAAIGFTRIFKAVLPADIPFIFDMLQIAKFSGILFLVSIFGSLLSVFNIVKADPIQAMGRIE